MANVSSDDAATQSMPLLPLVNFTLPCLLQVQPFIRSCAICCWCLTWVSLTCCVCVFANIQVDIGVIWRAHMMLPCTYRSDILRLQGVGNESKGVSKKIGSCRVPYINACPAWSWDAQGARAREALIHTKDVYVKTFGEPYVTAGSAFSAPLNQIPPHSNSSSQNEGKNGKRNERAGGTKGLAGNENVPDHIRPTNTHRALLTSTSFQIVIDLVGPFGTCVSVPVASSSVANQSTQLLYSPAHVPACICTPHRGRNVRGRPSVSHHVVSAHAHQRRFARRDESIDRAITARAHWRGCWRVTLSPCDYV